MAAKARIHVATHRAIWGEGTMRHAYMYRHPAVAAILRKILAAAAAAAAADTITTIVFAALARSLTIQVIPDSKVGIAVADLCCVSPCPDSTTCRNTTTATATGVIHICYCTRTPVFDVFMSRSRSSGSSSSSGTGSS